MSYVTMGVLLRAAIMVLAWQEAAGIIAYDCEDPAAVMSTISLRDVARCPEPDLAYTSEKTLVTVVQRNEVRQQRVWSCLIEIVRLISYCGMHSHSSNVAGGLGNIVHRVGAEECRLIHRDGTVKLYANTIGGIAANATTTASVTLLGQLSNDGTCVGTMYQENGQTWNNVVILATVKITLRDYWAPVKMTENEISLRGRTTCTFLEGYCFDAEIGEAVWDTERPDRCDNHLSVLYEGEAEEVTNTLTKERYLVVEDDSRVFALTYVKEGRICELDVWLTEHPRIAVLRGRRPVEGETLTTQDVHLIDFINSKFLYVEQGFKRDLDKLYMDTVHRRCLLQREILKNRLLMAPILPNAIGHLIQAQEGFVGRVLGEVLYILKCVPVPVSIRRTDRCYNELPIEVNNQSKFMTPLTRVIQELAEEVDCNGLTTPLYFLNEEWIGLTPYPSVKHPPKELEVERAQRLNFTPIAPAGAQGLYTSEEIEKVQRIMMFGSERKAVDNIITRKVIGMDTHNQGLSPLKMFNAEEIKVLTQNTLRHLWGWFYDFGVIISGLIGFYVIFKIIKYIIGVVLNGLQLYRTAGIGMHLIASLWNTLTMCVLQHYREKDPRDRQQFPNDDEERGQEDPDPLTEKGHKSASLPMLNLAPRTNPRTRSTSVRDLAAKGGLATHWTQELPSMTAHREDEETM